MSSGTASKSTRPFAKAADRIGPRIIRAWFDTVLNPLLRALRVERELLVKRDWTWRFRPGGLESIRPVRAYIDPEARDNLEQVRELNPFTARVMDLHDRGVAELSARCERLYEAIRKSKDLLEMYREVTSAESLAELDTSMPDLFGAYPQRDHLAILAEHVVNRSGTLPPYYSIAPLWNRHKNRLLGLLRASSAIRFHDAAANAAGKKLLRDSERLEDWLSKTRMRMSLDHDVPYVAAGKLSNAHTEESF